MTHFFPIDKPEFRSLLTKVQKQRHINIRCYTVPRSRAERGRAA